MPINNELLHTIKRTRGLPTAAGILSAYFLSLGMFTGANYDQKSTRSDVAAARNLVKTDQNYMVSVEAYRQRLREGFGSSCFRLIGEAGGIVGSRIANAPGSPCGKNVGQILVEMSEFQHAVSFGSEQESLLKIDEHSLAQDIASEKESFEGVVLDSIPDSLIGGGAAAISLLGLKALAVRKERKW